MALFVEKAASADGRLREAVRAEPRLSIIRLISPVAVAGERTTFRRMRQARLAQMAVVVLVNMVGRPERVVLGRRTQAVTATLVALVAVAVQTVKAVTAKFTKMILVELAGAVATARIIRPLSNVSALVVVALVLDLSEQAVCLTAERAGFHSKTKAQTEGRLRVISVGPVAVAAVHTITARA
jgi:hypothetical protein